MSDELIVGNVEPNSTVSYEQWLDYIKTQTQINGIFDIKAVEQMSEIIEAYSQMPVCIYENKAYVMRNVKSENLAEFLEHYKQKNQKVIMYQIINTKYITENSESSAAMNVGEFWKIRFAVVGDTV